MTPKRITNDHEFSHAAHRPFGVVLGLLLLVYGVWFLSYWPGALGEDSLAILLEAETEGVFQSGKPVFWYYFVKWLYMPWGLVEMPIGVQLLVTALVFARILGWCWQQGLKSRFWFLLVFIAIAPHTILFSASLYADGIFAVATVGLLFEIWLLAQYKQSTATSLLIIAVCLPFALFARSNGVVLVLSVAYAAYACGGWGRWLLIGYTVLWFGLNYIGGQMHVTKQHDVLFPLAAFETANFLQPRPMNLTETEHRVSEKSIQLLSKFQPIQRTIESYDRDYWDPLVYFPSGPDLSQLNEAERVALVKEFFTYNLWHNLPAFVSSRVNIFLVASLAQGGFQYYENAETVLKRVHSRTEYRPFHFTAAVGVLQQVHDFSFRYRWLFWTPFFGMFLLVQLTRKALLARQFALLALTLPMLAQLLGIFVFSPAGEYRYLLPFALLPMAMLPIWGSLTRERIHTP